MAGAGVGPSDELVDGGLDHPGPVVDDRWVSAVSFAVTSFECDVVVWSGGFSTGT